MSLESVESLECFERTAKYVALSDESIDLIAEEIFHLVTEDRESLECHVKSVVEYEVNTHRHLDLTREAAELRRRLVERLRRYDWSVYGQRCPEEGEFIRVFLK